MLSLFFNILGIGSALSDTHLRNISKSIPAENFMDLALELGMTRVQASHLENDYKHAADRFFHLLVNWRNKRGKSVEINNLQHELESAIERCGRYPLQKRFGKVYKFGAYQSVTVYACQDVLPVTIVIT